MKEYSSLSGDYKLMDRIKEMMKCTDQWIEERLKVLIDERLERRKDAN